MCIVKYTGGALPYYKVVLIDFVITVLVIVALAVLLVKLVDAKGIKLANLVAEKAFPKEKKHESQ